MTHQTKQNKTKQNKIKQNNTKQYKIKQSKTKKQNKTCKTKHPSTTWCCMFVNDDRPG